MGNYGSHFTPMGDAQAIEAAKVMSGLAMALKQTAMGLVVAIPSIVFYNVLLRKMDKLSVSWDIKQKS